MDTLTIFPGSDNLLEVEHLQDDATGEILGTAAVAVTVRDAAGLEVGGQTWPLTMAHVGSSRGVYRCTLADTLAFTPGDRYIATVTADAGPGRRAVWTVDMVCKPRRR